MQANSAHPGNLAFRQGLLFGILLGIFSIVVNVILNLAKVATLLAGAIGLERMGALLTILGLLVAGLVYLLAGMRAAQQTGKVATGALAGLWTGLISAVITWGYSLVFMYATHGQAPTVAHLLLQIALFALLNIALALGLGAGLGALGGLLRKR